MESPLTLEEELIALGPEPAAEWQDTVTGIFYEGGPVETRTVTWHTFTGSEAKWKWHLKRQNILKRYAVAA